MNKKKVVTPREFFEQYDHIKAIAIDKNGEQYAFDSGNITKRLASWSSDGDVNLELSNLNITLPRRYTDKPWDETLLKREDFVTDDTPKEKPSPKFTIDEDVLEDSFIFSRSIHNLLLTTFRDAMKTNKPFVLLDTGKDNVDSMVYALHSTFSHDEKKSKYPNGEAMHRICTSKNSAVERYQALFDYYKKELLNELFRKIFRKNSSGSFELEFNGSDILDAFKE